MERKVLYNIAKWSAIGHTVFGAIALFYGNVTQLAATYILSFGLLGMLYLKQMNVE